MYTNRSHEQMTDNAGISSALVSLDELLGVLVRRARALEGELDKITKVGRFQIHGARFFRGVISSVFLLIPSAKTQTSSRFVIKLV